MLLTRSPVHLLLTLADVAFHTNPLLSPSDVVDLCMNFFGSIITQKIQVF